MERRVEKNGGKKRLTGGAITIIVIATIFVAVLGVAGFFYIRISGMSANAVPIVSKDPWNAVMPTPEQNLEIVDGEPEDIAEDYDDPSPVETTETPIYYLESIEEDYINILLIGSDSQTGDAQGGRSDTMMLLSYDIKNNRVSLISLLRDIWAPIEGHGNNRLNTAFRFGGAGLTVNTINNLFGLDIQNYITVDFSSMVDLVDRIGGIDINITKREASYYNENFGWGIDEGINHLNGQQTLVHARNRKSGGGDFERTRRQRDVLLAVYKKVAGSADLAMLSDMFSYFMDHVETNMSPSKLFSLAVKAVSSDASLSIDQGRIPVDHSWHYANKNGRSVIVIDFDENRRWLIEFLYHNEP